MALDMIFLIEPFNVTYALLCMARAAKRKVSLTCRRCFYAIARNRHYISGRFDSGIIELKFSCIVFQPDCISDNTLYIFASVYNQVVFVKVIAVHETTYGIIGFKLVISCNALSGKLR